MKLAISIISVTLGDACQAFTAHGFVGRERAVMTAIHEWITVRKLEPVVGKSE